MGIEAVSRGAERATFIEQDSLLVKYLEENLVSLNLEEEVIRSDVHTKLKDLDRQRKRYGVVYADPPYSFRDLEALLDLIRPLAPGGEVAIEARAPHPLAEICQKLLTYGQTEIACFFVEDPGMNRE